ncbi:hypothetical protein GCM10009747_33600 [Agromyces humatus]|uniref:Uncharacterized protein n=1 Tax=Agromyces humatus TaxID=279573 RepID=A0ABP4X7N9_9MICO
MEHVPPYLYLLHTYYSFLPFLLSLIEWDMFRLFLPSVHAGCSLFRYLFRIGAETASACSETASACSERLGRSLAAVAARSLYLFRHLFREPDSARLSRSFGHPHSVTRSAWHPLGGAGVRGCAPASSRRPGRSV